MAPSAWVTGRGRRCLAETQQARPHRSASTQRPPLASRCGLRDAQSGSARRDRAQTISRATGTSAGRESQARGAGARRL